MEPKIPTPDIGPDAPLSHYGPGGEREQSAARPQEARIERGGEQMEQRGEASLAQATVIPVLPAPVVTTPADDNANSTAAASDDDMPTIANDDDLIEKEWVDKAKKIIKETKDDPYRREQEVNKLQADYLRKRYGRELGVSR